MLSRRLKVLSVLTLFVAATYTYVFAVATPPNGIPAESVNVSGTCVPAEIPLTPIEKAQLQQKVALKRAEVEKLLQTIPQLRGAKIKVVAFIAPWGKNCADKGSVYIAGIVTLKQKRVIEAFERQFKGSVKSRGDNIFVGNNVGVTK